MRTFIQTELKNTYGTEAESIIKCISPDLWQSMAYILLGCSSVKRRIEGGDSRESKSA